MLSGPSNLILEIEGKNSLLAFLALGSAMTDGRWLSTRLLRNSSDGIMQSQWSHKKSQHAQWIQRIKNRDQTSYMLLPSTFCIAFISADWPLRCCITTVTTSFFEELPCFLHGLWGVFHAFFKAFLHAAHLFVVVTWPVAVLKTSSHQLPWSLNIPGKSAFLWVTNDLRERSKNLNRAKNIGRQPTQK